MKTKATRDAAVIARKYDGSHPPQMAAQLVSTPEATWEPQVHV